jgi:hypothetical protein
MKKWVFRGVISSILIVIAIFLIFTFVAGFSTPQDTVESESLQLLATKNKISADEIVPAGKLLYGNTYSLLFVMPDGSLGYAIWQKRLWDTNYKIADTAQYGKSDGEKGFLANDYLSTYIIEINGTKLEYAKSIMRPEAGYGLISFSAIIIIVLLFHFIRKKSSRLS